MAERGSGNLRSTAVVIICDVNTSKILNLILVIFYSILVCKIRFKHILVCQISYYTTTTTLYLLIIFFFYNYILKIPTHI